MSWRCQHDHGNFRCHYQRCRDLESDFNARFVAHRNRDCEEYQLKHNFNNFIMSINRYSIHIGIRSLDRGHIASLSAMRPWATSRKTPYAKPIIEILWRICLQSIVGLDGLDHSEDYWHAKFAENLTHDQGMRTLSSNISLFFWSAREQVTGLLFHDFTSNTIPTCTACALKVAVVPFALQVLWNGSCDGVTLPSGGQVIPLARSHCQQGWHYWLSVISVMFQLYLSSKI